MSAPPAPPAAPTPAGPAGKAALLGGAQVYYKLTGFALFAVAARTVPEAALGDLFTAMAFASTFVVAIGLGLPPLVMRRVARAPATAAEEASRLLGFRLLTLPAFIAAIALAGFLLHRPAWPLWAAGALLVGGEDAYASLGAVFLGLSRPQINVAIGIPVQTLLVGGGAAAMFLAGGVWALVAAQAVRVVLLVGAAALVARRLLGDVRPTLRPGVLDGAAPFAMAAAIAAVAEQADPLLVGLFRSSETMARYQLALRTLAAAAFVPVVLSVVIYPLVAARGIAATRRLVTAALAVLAAGGVAAALVTLAARGPLARALFGAAAGAGVAAVLATMAPLFGLVWLQTFLVSMLQAAGRERAAVRILGAGTLLGVAVGVPGVRAFGVGGAVAARAAAVSVQIVLAGWLLLRRSPPAPR